MTRIKQAMAIFSVTAAALCPVLLSAADRPNIVFILTDNHGAWTLGCYGNPDIRTPHIDRLAAQGIRFTRAFSSNAVCSPTRASGVEARMRARASTRFPLRCGSRPGRAS